MSEDRYPTDGYSQPAAAAAIRARRAERIAYWLPLLGGMACVAFGFRRLSRFERVSALGGIGLIIGAIDGWLKSPRPVARGSLASQATSDDEPTVFPPSAAESCAGAEHNTSRASGPMRTSPSPGLPRHVK